MMNSLEYKLDLQVSENLLYKNLFCKWNFARVNSVGETSIETIMEDILKEDVGIPAHLSVEALAGLKVPIGKLLAKKSQIEKDYLDMVQDGGKYEESGLSVGKSLTSILKSAIPLDLIGGKKNREQLLINFRKAFKFGKSDVLSLGFFLYKLNIKTVTWLKPLENDTTRRHVMAKLVKWLWRIAKRLVTSQYYVTETQNTCNRLMYIPKKVWQSRTDAALGLLVKGGTLEPLLLDQAEKLATKRRPATVRWLPKGDKLRPIISVKGDKNLHDIVIAKVFLRDLLRKRYTNVDVRKLHQTWRRVIKYFHVHKRPLFLVATDISDAYGSINQKKLLDIVKEEMRLHFGKITSTKEVHIESAFVKNKRVLWCRELHLGESPINKQVKTVRLLSLLKTIGETVRLQTIQIKKKRYWMKKGISQAMSLSASLCNLYLAHLDQTNLSQFMTNHEDTMIRVVDDYLYITPSKDRAQQFLDTMSAGFKDYEIQINQAKTQTNLNGHMEINYYGFLINSANLEVYVKYNHGADVPFRSSMTFNNKKEPLRKLEDKLEEIPKYKMRLLCMDRLYMSERGVARNVFQTACLMACTLKTLVDTWLTPVDNTQLLFVIKNNATNLACKAEGLSNYGGFFRATDDNLEKRTRGPKMEELRWIVIRAFWLSLSHCRFRENNDFPEALLPFLEEEEEQARSKVDPQTLDLLFDIVEFLPEQFNTGH